MFEIDIHKLKDEKFVFVIFFSQYNYNYVITIALCVAFNEFKCS